MTRDLAAVADFDPFLNLHECSDLHVIPEFTTIKIGESVDANVFPQLHIGSDLLIWIL
jgi:hypothetical protein